MQIKLTRKKWILILVLILVVVGLVWHGHSHPAGRLFTLPSGKQILVTGVGPRHFPSGETALVMACDTDISIDDTVALRKEVDEIWGLFRKDVEGAGLTNGVIRIVHPEGSGLITQSKGYGFGFIKRPDGSWHCLQDEKK
jgi:hypothetical protein